MRTVNESPYSCFTKNRYTTIGAQIKKLAKPIIKNVGISFSGTACSAQIRVKAVHAHRSIIIQNTRRAIFSIIQELTITGH